mmetsp:Transcript_39635/g.109124  ORF Transcript_39635/g.109124 Transcript_39635/m.109124 type:complete len:244 (-) Transcript_39635:584-1315(-)
MRRSLKCSITAHSSASLGTAAAASSPPKPSRALTYQTLGKGTATDCRSKEIRGQGGPRRVWVGADKRAGSGHPKEGILKEPARCGLSKSGTCASVAPQRASRHARTSLSRRTCGLRTAVVLQVNTCTCVYSTVGRKLHPPRTMVLAASAASPPAAAGASTPEMRAAAVAKMEPSPPMAVTRSACSCSQLGAGSNLSCSAVTSAAASVFETGLGLTHTATAALHPRPCSSAHTIRATSTPTALV